MSRKWTSSRRSGCATSSRTPSRGMPRDSGGPTAVVSSGEGNRVVGATGRAVTRPPRWRRYSLARYRPLGGAVSRSRSSAGTTVSGSGRSLMSSPGNAAWCMAVRMSPGSTAYHRSGRLLGREGADEVVQRGLARAVRAPALVVLDGGVRRDGEDGAAGRDEVREQLAGERRRRHEVRLAGRSRRVCGVEVRERGLRAAAELAGVVDEQVQRAVEAHRRRQLGPVGAVGDGARRPPRRW